MFGIEKKKENGKNGYYIVNISKGTYVNMYEDIPSHFSMSGAQSHANLAMRDTHILIYSHTHIIQESKSPELLSLLHALSVGPLSS